MNPPCWFHLLTQIWHGLICGHCGVKSVDAFPWKRRSVWCSSFVSDPYTISKRLQALSMHNKDWKITHNHTMCKLAALYTCVLIALNPTFSASIGAGCDIIATSTSSNTPSSNKIICHHHLLLLAYQLQITAKIMIKLFSKNILLFIFTINVVWLCTSYLMAIKQIYHPC